MAAAGHLSRHNQIMSRGLRLLLAAAFAAWGGCALGMQLGRVEAALAAVGAANILLLASYRRRKEVWTLAAAFVVCVGLGAERGSRVQVLEEGMRVNGRITETVADGRGTRLTLASDSGAPLHVRVPRTGQAWLDEFPPGVGPGSRVSISLSPAGKGRRFRSALSARSVRLLQPAGWMAGLFAQPARWRQEFVARARVRLVNGPWDREGLLLLAMVAGEKHALPTELREDLRASGLAHVAVVSGMHVGLLVALLPWLAGVLIGRRHRSLAVGALGGVGLAASLLPGSSPVRRACLAIGSTHAARLVGRSGNPRAALGMAMLVLLVLAPEVSTSWSFSLTVMASLAIVFAASEPGAMGKVRVACAPVLATWPLLILMCGRVSPWALISNVLALPAIPSALMLGWLRVLLPDDPAVICGGVDWLARHAALWICELAEEAARWPGSGRMAAPVGAIWVGLHYACLAGLLLVRGRWRRVCGLCVFLSWCWPMLPLAWPAIPVDGIYVMNVGQGQAVLMQEQGRSVLVDAADDRSREGTRAMLADLRRLGVRRLEGLIISHADRDHSGGASAVLSALAPSYLALPMAQADGWGFVRLVSAASRRGIPTRHLQAGDRIFSGVVLYPPPGARLDGNAASIVLSMRVAGMEVLIPGDADLAAEESFVDRLAAQPRLDLLVAGHHGSRTSTGEPLLKACLPLLVAFSCGVDNPHGHPHSQTLERVDNHGCATWITARSGGLLARRVGGRLVWERM